MNADSFFTKGDGHTICQDHATTARVGDLTFAAISDGCSSSAKSEVGAGILAHAFCKQYHFTNELAIADDYSESDFDVVLKAGLRHRLTEIARLIGLDHSAFDATLVAAVADTRLNKLFVYLWGDGHVKLDFKEGEPLIISNRYANNAPYYFSYGLTDARAQGYAQQFGDDKSELTWGTSSQPEKTEPLITRAWPLDVIKHVAVFSDGLETFSKVKDGTTQPIPLEGIILPLTAYKSVVGSFVARRMGRFLKDVKADGTSHFDDLSCAAITTET